MRMACLVVDDEAWARRVIRKVVGQLGGTCTEAANAEEGIATAGQVQPDVIVLDVRMPGRSGLEALADFREAAPEAQILILTAEYRDEDEEVARLPRVSYLQKNFWDLPTISRVIQYAASVAQTARQARQQHQKSQR